MACLVCQSTVAGEVQHAGVWRSDDVYYLDLAASIDADLDTVYRIATNYNELEQVSNLLLETDLINSPAAEGKRLHVLARSCFLIFCFKVRVVNDLAETDHTIHAAIVPALSDFKSGSTTWKFQRLDDNNSRMQVTGELVPDFWIPPVIGPFVIKRKMVREARKIIDHIEQLGGNA